MQYEIYIDSLFLLDFAMNLYLLLLLDRNLNHTATWKRLLGGAALGGAGYCLMFFLPIPYVPVKIMFVGIPVNALVLYVAFQPDSPALYKKMLERLCGYAFLFGGAFYALLRLFPFWRRYLSGLGGILLLGAILCLYFSYQSRTENRTRTCFVKVRLPDENGQMCSLTGLVDTGNGLREPISGKPVCLMEREVFESLYPKGREGLRMIPFRSVGCPKGILPGYPVPELIIEEDGRKTGHKQVYIGISDNVLSVQGGYQILLHPALCKEKHNAVPAMDAGTERNRKI